MTADDFREMALGFPGALESSHMNHPDFRAGGKVFATLGYPDRNCGMVKLTPEQQRSFIREAPGVFAPCAGGWGRQGATYIQLALAKESVVQTALETAFRNVKAKAQRRKKPHADS